MHAVTKDPVLMKYYLERENLGNSTQRIKRRWTSRFWWEAIHLPLCISGFINYFLLPFTNFYNDGFWQKLYWNSW